MTHHVINLIGDKSPENHREQQLSIISGITMEMLEKAKINDWEAVIDLESQRTALIADFFSNPVSGQEIPAVAHYIKKILEFDKQLIELGDKECHQLKKNLQKINHGKHAMKVYTAARY